MRQIIRTYNYQKKQGSGVLFVIYKEAGKKRNKSFSYGKRRTLKQAQALAAKFSADMKNWEIEKTDLKKIIIEAIQKKPRKNKKDPEGKRRKTYREIAEHIEAKYKIKTTRQYVHMVARELKQQEATERFKKGTSWKNSKPNTKNQSAKQP